MKVDVTALPTGVHGLPLSCRYTYALQIEGEIFILHWTAEVAMVCMARIHMKG